ncbi:DUF2459 domain-containing protein [Limibaculum sp. FT325]|uniref:DUF2459 domain-containing protein n=1 Tax=Thermohalobaculum sediminis TaxID=2939436 RepID=UPI0020BD7310|nr:DUF2459 domain-containing protein [Limibaculum sediminis]MCL5779127.1 DUF2459 domain-containing protein [Limibaculum sediminis]
MRTHLPGGLSLLLGLLLLAACTTAPAARDDTGPRVREVLVVSDGWHSGIVIPRGAILATGLMPEAEDFPGSAHLTFGWGDRAYYPAPVATVGLALDAAFLPTPAVMHVAARAHPPDPGSGSGEVLRVPLTERGFHALIAAIAGDFERPAGGRAAALGPGLAAVSGFYPARGRFHMFSTCNTWTARMLREGGVDIAPAGIVSARDLTTRLQAALDAQARVSASQISNG